MAVILSPMGLGPLFSSVNRIGVQVVVPGRLGADPASEVLMRADLVQQLLERVREGGGAPLARAQVARQQGMMVLDGEYSAAVIWDASITFGA